MSGAASFRRSVGGSGHNFARALRPSVFAIAFDMDGSVVQQSRHNLSWQDACSNIGKVLRDHGFSRQQGSVYFGDDSVDAVSCVLAVQALSRNFVWFAPAARDIRMLRIEDNNDLMPAVTSVTA